MEKEDTEKWRQDEHMHKEIFPRIPVVRSLVSAEHGRSVFGDPVVPLIFYSHGVLRGGFKKKPGKLSTFCG